jgi:hypothetical protein
MARPDLLTALLVAACLAGSVPAIAQEPPDGPPPDGPPAGPGRGAMLFISPSGEPFRGPDGLKRWFDGADTDHDGAISPAEFRADAMRFFKVLDADHDGMIDGGEIQTYETQIAPEITGLGLPDEGAGPRPDNGQGQGGGRRGGGMARGGRGDEGGGFGRQRGGGGREGAARYSLLNEPEPVLGADLNIDFKVSAAEWLNTADKRFTLLDTQAEGRLTPANLPPLPGRRGLKKK